MKNPLIALDRFVTKHHNKFAMFGLAAIIGSTITGLFSKFTKGAVTEAHLAGGAVVGGGLAISYFLIQSALETRRRTKQLKHIRKRKDLHIKLPRDIRPISTKRLKALRKMSDKQFALAILTKAVGPKRAKELLFGK